MSIRHLAIYRGYLENPVAYMNWNIAVICAYLVIDALYIGIVVACFRSLRHPH